MNTFEKIQQNSVAMSNNINELINKHKEGRRERVIVRAMTVVVVAAALFEAYYIINAIVS